MERKKVLGFWDLVFFSFCAIFGVEAIATSAAIGPSAISWWLIGILVYFLPYGLITAELGSTYPEQGGIYVWVKRALGPKWTARCTWYYWIGLPLWLPAIYIAIADIIGHMFFPDLGLWPKIFIGVAMIWIAVGINLCPLSVAKWIPNIGFVTRIAVVSGMIFAAVVYFMKNGRFANEITISNMLPNLNAAVIFIPVVLYNLLGCELVSSAAGEMKDPARDVPRAVIMSAAAIASLYLITTFVFWVVIPISEINVASGILHVFTNTFSGHSFAGAITVITGMLLSSTLFAEIVTWNLGQNRTVAEAANNGELPKILGTMTKNMAPLGSSIISGVISTTVIIVYGFIARDAGELFWHVISFSLIVSLFSDMTLFPSFIILRIRDKNIERPYRVPGPKWFAILLAVMAELFILMAVTILIMQPGKDFVRSALPIVGGLLTSIVVVEIFVANYNKKTRTAGRSEANIQL
jgi:amino acid transporter